jgi:uncharacterized protein YbbK (DUF523 family)
MEIGLGAPRETLRLAGDPAAPRMVATQSGRDLTETMTAYARRRVLELSREGLSGFGIAYMADQIYLAPHPKDLVLRNHT